MYWKLIIRAAKGFLPVIVKYWRELLIISVVVYAWFFVNGLINTVERQQKVIAQDLILIETLEEDVNVLKNSIETQNIEIDRLKKLADEQRDKLNLAEEESANIKIAYEAKIEDILNNKPKNIQSCEANMNWMLEKTGELQWK